MNLKFLTAGMALAALTASAMEGPPPILNPYARTSTSGVFALHVNPSDLYGRGPADYTMTRNGATTWTNRLPFTLWDVAVAGDGRAAGYAYTHGWRGFSEAGYRAGMGEFIVALISPSGSVICQTAEPRESSNYLHTPPNPLAVGCQLDEQANRFVIRLADPDVNRNVEIRRVYSLATGTWKKTARQKPPARPPPSSAAEEGDARPFDGPVLHLAEAGVIQLPIGGATTNVARTIAGFDFDAQGRIAVLRADRETPPTLQLLGPDGEVARELALPAGTLPDGVAFASPAHVGGARFVTAVSSRNVEGTASVFVVDFDAGTVSNLAVTCPAIMALAGFEDGRFAAQTIRYRRNSMVDGLYAFEPDGRTAWKIEKAGYGGRRDELLSPEDVARYGSHSVAVLDNIRHTIQVFDAAGRLERMFDMDETWGRKPNYPTHLATDADGGFIVYDFNARNPLVRLDAEGRVLSEAALRDPDGRPFHALDDVKRSPQGDLWTSDGYTLVQISASGDVERTLGARVQSHALHAPGLVHIDARGRSYVGDERTRAVHVFDTDGRAMGVCTPDAGDLTEISSVSEVAVSPGGNVYVAVGRDASRLQFDPSFKRVGVARIPVEPIGQDWTFAPTGNVSWIGTYHDVFLMEDLTNVLRKVSRRADGRWLEYPDAVSVAADGAAAVWAHHQSREVTVTVFRPDGAPQGTFALPSAWLYGARMAFNGRQVVVLAKEGLHLYASDGAVLGLHTLPPGGRWAGPFLPNDGREAWVVDGRTWTIHRFALPE